MIVIIFFTVVPIGVKTYLGELHLETCADHQGVLHLSQTDCDEGFSFVPNLSTLLSIITNILNYFLNYLGELHLETCADHQGVLHLSQTVCDKGFIFVPILATLLFLITKVLNCFLNYLGEFHLKT